MGGSDLKTIELQLRGLIENVLCSRLRELLWIVLKDNESWDLS